eukprot:1076755-Rhodomonas_salina.1
MFASARAGQVVKAWQPLCQYRTSRINAYARTGNRVLSACVSTRLQTRTSQYQTSPSVWADHC